ncbi:MAG: APC family permease [Nitrospinae bacterium]|nr:APC family permease [Nitrospinota bacterium]
MKKVLDWLFGPPRDPLNPETRQHIALVAFFAWVGLGADGLSSSCYGPEEAFLALGQHAQLGLYLALATAVTVFIISLGYNQIIALFPSGGGGYKVASKLIDPRAGLVSGAALIVDYVLTIVISVASGVDALFSLLPVSAQPLKLAAEVLLILTLILLNLRGMKESIAVLMPIFLGFVFTHGSLILYGILAHSDRIPELVPDTLRETFQLSGQIGWFSVAALLLRAYSLGGGTYTGIEAVSNNVNTLAEPRVKTGRLTMVYMAASLAFTAGGIILLYLLWSSSRVEGQTLNAVTFRAIMQDWQLGGFSPGPAILPVVMALEGGLLFVAANTGFLGGPAVLANMAADQWAPHQFSYLSSRLVTQNGILLMGVAGLGILVWSNGKVSLLVVLYSINVFLTFSLSLLGMCIYWWRHRRREPAWPWRLGLAASGFALTSGILTVTVVEKFLEGGWVTLSITSALIVLMTLIKRHYKKTGKRLAELDRLFAQLETRKEKTPPKLDSALPTAVFMVGKHLSAGMHSLLWVQRLFPGHFKNFVFLNAGEVDSKSFGGEEAVEKLKKDVQTLVDCYVNFCHNNDLAATSYQTFGTDAIEQLTLMADRIKEDFPKSMFFATKLIFAEENWLTRLLHNQTAIVMQRRLHLKGMPMVILPMKL